MVLENVLRSTYHGLQRTLPRVISETLAIKLGKKQRIPSNAEFNRFYQISHPDLVPQDPKDFMKNLYLAQYGKISEDSILPDTTVGNSQSWVPFKKGRTSVWIYNFYEKNYNIRDFILYRFVILGRDGEIFSVKNEVLPPTSVHFISDFFDSKLNPASVPEEGTLICQAFHPRIGTQGNQLRYFVMYSGADGIKSTVHSMPVPPDNLLTVGGLGFRNFGSNGTEATSIVQPKIPLATKELLSGDGRLSRLINSSPVIGNSYFLKLDAEGVPATIWHDGLTPHFVQPRETPIKLGPTVTGFATPDFEKFTPVLLLTTSQIGFRPEKISVQAHCQTDGRTESRMVQRYFSITQEEVTCDLGLLFKNDNLQGPVGFIIDYGRDTGDFKTLPEGMTHIYFRNGDNIFDQVHSEVGIGFHNSVSPTPKSYRARKFAPFFKDENLDCCYTVVDVGGLLNKTPAPTFARLITDQGFELRFELKLNEFGVTVFKGGELFNDLLPKISKTAVIQLENYERNISGTWYIENKKSCSLASDHFTGG